MGQSESKGKKLFLSVFKHMLSGRGLKISDKSLQEFYDFVQKISPWFPEEGSLTLEDWKRVGKDMRKFHEENLSRNVPDSAFILWQQMRDLLTEKTDLEFLAEEAPSELSDDQKVKPNTGKKKSYCSRKKGIKLEKSESEITDSENDDEWERTKGMAKCVIKGRKDRFSKHTDSSEEESLIITPAARRPVPKPRRLLPPVGFDAAVAEAKRQGDFTLTCPVICEEGSEPQWEPLSLKTLKELQSAVKTLGPTAPYTLQVLDAVASQWLTPYDWYQTAKATLAPGDFILWRTEYEERARKLVQERSSSRNGARPTVPMLLGQKDYARPAAQLNIPKAVLERINQIAISSWRSLPVPGAKSTVLSGIRQKHDESYESFVARLEEAVSRMLPPSEGTDILMKQLACVPCVET